MPACLFWKRALTRVALNADLMQMGRPSLSPAMARTCYGLVTKKYQVPGDKAQVSGYEGWEEGLTTKEQEGTFWRVLS